MASEINKKRALYIYKVFNLYHWSLFLAVTVTDGLAIGFAEGTSGYWGGGVAVAIMMCYISIQDAIILRNVMRYDKDELDKRKFIDTFNWQGVNLLVNIVVCLIGAGIAVGIGSNYGRVHDDKNKKSTNTTVHCNEEFVNIKENRTIAILLAAFCGITLAVMIRSLCLHREVRAALGLPEKNINNSARPAPAQPSTNTTTAQSLSQIQLTAENNLLKEQNRLQREQLEQMTALRQHIQSISVIGAARSMPPPPYYHTLPSAGHPSGYVCPAIPSPE